MPELEQKQFQKRLVAYKIDVSKIVNSKFLRDELSAGFLQIGELKVSRVNIIGTVVHISEQNGNSVASIDDGTGRMPLRTFEQTNILSKIEVGDLVLLVGKVREFNNEKYLIPEIIKKFENLDWMSLRKKEVSLLPLSLENLDPKEPPKSPGADVYDLIKSMDSGDGVPIEDIIKKSDDANAEIKVSRLLEKGDIFEIRPGRLKVLE